MFNWLKQNKKGEVKEFEVLNMHCVSCAMNIDGGLEELPGVISSNTNYAKGKAVLEFEKGVDFKKVKEVVVKLGYKVKGLD